MFRAGAKAFFIFAILLRANAKDLHTDVLFVHIPRKNPRSELDIGAGNGVFQGG